MTDGAPTDLLACHPETAYFWGHVAGDGDVRTDEITVRAPDEACADRLVAVAGGGAVDHRRTERPYAHDATVTRTEDEYRVTVTGDVAARASAAFGLPTGDERGGYRLDVFADAERQLLRGLLESCGTVCFKSSSGTVGVSFVHDDRTLLDTVAGLLDTCPVDAPTDEIQASSSGGYWFGVADEAADAFGRWVYDGSEETDLFAPTRRRKLVRSLEQAENA
ncbi:cobalamin biosynthesis protein [Salinirarus marinus]|uniref:cobalamin biosynthesis protein n=1 Tax=Salinirarus marinus TaxID=3068310 RepID=UPI003C6BE0F3